MGLLQSFDDVNDPTFSTTLGKTAVRPGSGLIADAQRNAQKMVGSAFTVPLVKPGVTPGSGTKLGGCFICDKIKEWWSPSGLFTEPSGTPGAGGQNPFTLSLMSKIIIGVVVIVLGTVALRAFVLRR